MIFMQKSKRPRYSKNLKLSLLKRVMAIAKRHGILIKQFFFLSGFFFTNIHDSQDSSGSGEAISLTPLYHFYPLHS